MKVTLSSGVTSVMSMLLCAKAVLETGKPYVLENSVGVKP